MTATIAMTPARKGTRRFTLQAFLYTIGDKLGAKALVAG